MANYGVTNSTQFTAQTTCLSTYQALFSVAASTANTGAGGLVTGLRRGKLYDLLVGTNGAPADNYIEWVVHRITDTAQTLAGNISSVSSQFALDLADNGFAAHAGVNGSSNPSSTVYGFLSAGGIPWYVGVNQRASYRWVAAPGSEIVWPAVSSGTGGNGLALSFRSASGGYTGPGTCTVMFQEQ